MNRLRTLSILVVIAVSLLLNGCRTLCCVDRSGRARFGDLNQTFVQVVRDDGNYTVHPHTALAYVGNPVVWVSTGAPINRIEWLTPLDSKQNPQPDWPRLDELQCASTARELCWVDIPNRFQYGIYPYYLYISVGGREVKINQPELDIRG